MDSRRISRACAALAMVSALFAPRAVWGQQRVLLPEGTVLTVTTDQRLSSASMRQGATFTTTVEDSVNVEGYTVIPAGSRIAGVVTFVRPATRNDSGVLGVEFDELRLAGGSTIAIEGKLTSTDPAERRQIDAREDSQVVLVGGRQGVGGVIGAIGAGQESDPVSGILGAIGAMLSEGSDVELPAGTRAAVQLERSVVLNAVGAPARRPDAFTIYTAAETIRAAQEALRGRGYYRGPTDGQLTDATQRALLAFQIDNGVLATGNLDGRTAELLGLEVSVVSALTPNEASYLRGLAQDLVNRWRASIGVSTTGRMDSRRLYEEDEVGLWFALSGFADAAGLYEQVVRTSGNVPGLAAAGAALVESARTVDEAMVGVQLPARTQRSWDAVRQEIQILDPQYAGP
ncbi:MAG TPA: peptidoglycan-binding domain-containing protein [Gemmatimonadota bacterium]|nr:peptidoglycan-binding domain-containing protein [Gemmatimonadota bacterium]